MVKSTSCRVCEKVYNDTGSSYEHRKNIFKRDSDSNCIQTRFAKFNYNLPHENGKSDSICKKCYTSLVTLERADSILVQLQVRAELGVGADEATLENSVEIPTNNVSHFSLSLQYFRLS